MVSALLTMLIVAIEHDVAVALTIRPRNDHGNVKRLRLRCVLVMCRLEAAGCRW